MSGYVWLGPDTSINSRGGILEENTMKRVAPGETSRKIELVG